MTNQQSSPFTADELVTRTLASLNLSLNPLIITNLTLEKQLVAQAQQIQTLTKQEADTFKLIRELEAELAEMKETIQVLLPEPAAEETSLAYPVTMPPEAAEIAAGGRKIIQGQETEKKEVDSQSI